MRLRLSFSQYTTGIGKMQSGNNSPINIPGKSRVVVTFVLLPYGISAGLQCHREYAAAPYFYPVLDAPVHIRRDDSVEVVGTSLLVSSKEQKILGLSNHRTGDYSFPINAANTSSNFHLILICSASYTRTCSTKIRSSSLVSVFASLY